MRFHLLTSSIEIALSRLLLAALKARLDPQLRTELQSGVSSLQSVFQRIRDHETSLPLPLEQAPVGTTVQAPGAKNKGS